MPNIFSRPKQEILREPLPKPEPPVAIPEKGEAEVTKKRQLIQGGRGRTILAGQLTPKKIGRTQVLGL